ncbi:hypothetical protein ACFX2B_041143 [Malus domestica]
MLCTGRLLAVSFPVNRCSPYKLHSAGCSKFSYPRSPISTSSSRWRSLAMASEPNSSSFAPSVDSDPNPAADTNPAGYSPPPSLLSRKLTEGGNLKFQALDCYFAL